jgi:hypothetical protein
VADAIIAEFHLNAAMLGLLTSIYFLGGRIITDKL